MQVGRITDLRGDYDKWRAIMADNRDTELRNTLAERNAAAAMIDQIYHLCGTNPGSPVVQRIHSEIQDLYRDMPTLQVTVWDAPDRDHGEEMEDVTTLDHKGGQE